MFSSINSMEAPHRFGIAGHPRLDTLRNTFIRTNKIIADFPELVIRENAYKSGVVGDVGRGKEGIDVKSQVCNRLIS